MTTNRTTADAIEAELKRDGYGLFMARSEVARALGRCYRTVVNYEKAGALDPIRPTEKAHPMFLRSRVAEFMAGES